MQMSNMGQLLDSSYMALDILYRQGRTIDNAMSQVNAVQAQTGFSESLLGALRSSWKWLFGVPSNPDGEQSGPRDERSGPRDERSGQRDEQSGPRDERSGQRDEQSGPRDERSGSQGMPSEDLKTILKLQRAIGATLDKQMGSLIQLDEDTDTVISGVQSNNDKIRTI
jgi:hypothetical protein